MPCKMQFAGREATPFLKRTVWSFGLISSMTKLAYSGRSALSCRHASGLNRYAFSFTVPLAMR